VSVAAALYPLAYLVRQIGGPVLRVDNLTTPGAEPHELELNASRIKHIQQARLVVYLGSGFQPAVQAAAGKARDRAVDLLPARTSRRSDPHMWLDPEAMRQAGAVFERRLEATDQSHAANYRARGAVFDSKLATLAGEFRAGLRRCQRRDIFTSHQAFGRLAARYGLRQIGIAGRSPEDEPTPRRLAQLTRLAARSGATTIFVEKLGSSKLSETAAAEIGARTAELDPVEGAPDTGDYLSAMRGNLAALKLALGCA